MFRIDKYQIVRRLALIGLVFTACSFRPPGGSDINAKVKAIFLYNFSKYVDWPEHMASGRFKIAIYGHYPALKEELIRMSKVKRRGDRSFEILMFDTPEKIVPTHILFVVKAKSVDMAYINRKLKKTSTLLVTEEDELINRGANINLYYENNKQRMEINPSNFDAKGLKISEELMSISKVVNG
ncbi:YfiR family protein [Fulvivirga sp. M361]|uniref:YfiR family protein n=1 Tax=Fulvivirga sp. M361 TaxID=2594266 RepID=UPI00117A3783|nr:YfiR family protein [Fulvivirga sp. M361]TRX52043.1 YfiR family protein [Fulvivirga sp. M361]